METYRTCTCPLPKFNRVYALAGLSHYLTLDILSIVPSVDTERPGPQHAIQAQRCIPCIV